MIAAEACFLSATIGYGDIGARQQSDRRLTDEICNNWKANHATLANLRLLSGLFAL